MIKRLTLNNLVLVDSCEIDFGTSFNAVTGETGAGKTALIEAIGLALGERADSGLIRKGCDKAHVEVSFDIDALPYIQEMLEEAGLSTGKDEELVIRREISKEGKNRAFVNCRMATLPFLNKIGASLIDLIGQHAHQTLRTNDSQRSIVDLFGSLEDILKDFQSSYEKEKERLKKLEELQQLSSHRERDEDTWRFQLEEIESVALKKGEEEEAFEKYQKLAHSRELAEKIDLALKGLSESSHAVIPQVSRYIKAIDSLLTYDKTLSDASTLLHESHIALSEALRSLQSYSQNIDSDPHAFQHLENRLGAISRLKRKYGQSFEEIETYRLKIQSELKRLENISEELKAAELSLEIARGETNEKAKLLTSKRKEAALKLQQTLTTQLQHLNMSGAEVIIEIVESARHHGGDDTVQFWLKANTGEHPGLVKEHSSGGELSRLLFAIKIALAEKNNTPTLIFDEIDANVGGKTATIIGEKLQELGKCRQVICITHFPQVASKANEHFNVEKIETDGRTLTEIKHLNKKQREQELLRMIGGEKLDFSVR
ncbi:MAG: DNA repair protein RecN [Verrucomicrobia bacterium]|nr:DNA repair protein RecN [Verrucomicrobiota bacterium]